jgi:lysophospholipase L1-like esterase
MKTMVCIGDSLTEGTDIPTCRTWPALTANALGLDAINCGIGGDTTTGMLSRFYPEVVAVNPAFVFIMGGTNDLWWDWEVNTVLGNLFSIVVQARHHGIAPIIGLPIPVNVPAAQTNDFSPPQGGYDRLTVQMAALVEELTRHAAASEVTAVDLYHSFFSDNQDVRADLFLPDGLHPNRAGHLAIAQAIALSFRQDLNFP